MLAEPQTGTYSKDSSYRSIVSALFTIITGALAALIVYTAPQYSFGSELFQTSMIEPVSQHFSAPLENTKKDLERRQIIGFLPYWAVGNKAKVYPEYMDQMIYFGLTMDQSGKLQTEDKNGNTLPEWNSLNSAYFKSLRENARKTDTKVLIAIKNFNNDEINTLISNPTSVQTAIREIKAIITEYELDGVNIDFEYVTRSDFPTQKFYNQFLKILADDLREEKADIIISFDVNATAVYADMAYDMVKIGDTVDQVIIMGYDYSQPSSVAAGPVSPIEMNDNSPSLSRTLDSLKGRVEPEKTVLGVPFYGYEWQTLTDDFRSKTVPHTGAIATYKRVRELIANKETVSIQYDPDSKSPWITYRQNGRIKQIYYEDEKSLESKIEFIHDRDLAGIAIWSLGYEGDYIEPWIVIKGGIWQE
ncbi:hypothetical protein IPM65_06200 [Candidatus Roizmanbacteria bacterium]|nr:MAG: hypothetical protein IPM65_06200 [Candidatus Roizmanbacteria bacterium]